MTEQEIKRLVAEAQARFDALTPEQQAAHREEQRQSWIRGMTARCEHGELDWEQCPGCRTGNELMALSRNRRKIIECTAEGKAAVMAKFAEMEAIDD